MHETDSKYLVPRGQQEKVLAQLRGEMMKRRAAEAETQRRADLYPDFLSVLSYAQELIEVGLLISKGNDRSEFARCLIRMNDLLKIAKGNQS